MSNDDENNVALVIQEQPETQIYWGAYSHLVIKQDRQNGDGEDLILFNPIVLPLVIRCPEEKWRDYGLSKPSCAPSPPPEQHPTTEKPLKKKGGPT